MAPSGITAGLVAFCVAALLFSFPFLLAGTLLLFGFYCSFLQVSFFVSPAHFSQIIELITLVTMCDDLLKVSRRILGFFFHQCNMVTTTLLLGLEFMD